MPVIYIREQGTMLCKRGERLVVTKNDRVLLDQPLIGVDGVSVFGNVQISTQAAVMLMERGIDVSLFSYSGKYLGHLVSDKSKNIFLRMTQYAVYQDEEKRLQIAREIVRNKIDNQISVIRQHRFRDTFPWKEDVALLVDYRDRLNQQKTANEILGIEGICSNVYFHSYGAMFKSNIKFEKRSRRPPKDPANVILSLAYTLLTKEVCGVLDAESFEPYLGFLHGVRYGRKSLALDIVEEFRQPMADRLVLKVFNKRILSEYDFEYDDDNQIVLSEEGFRRFCMAYEKWITGRDVTSGDRSFRSRIRQQSAHLKSSLLNSQIYKPYKWKQSDVSDQL